MRPRTEAGNESRSGGMAVLSRVTSPGPLLPFAALVVAALSTLRVTHWYFTKQDVNFDLRAYHGYLGWAVFHDGVDLDVHPVSGSYLNPALDVLNYVALTQLSAAWGAALLMTVQLSTVVPLYLITRLLVPRLPRFAAAAVAVLALGGSLVTSEWGTTFNDLTNSVPLLWGIWALLGADLHSRWRPAVGGFLVGAAVGLKLTSAPYGVAACALGVVLLPHLWPLVRLGAGLAAGFLVAAGPWMLVMWREFKNPVFPLLNGIFNSPYAGGTDVAADPRFGTHGIGGVLFLPFKLVAAPAGLTGELPSSDWRWPLWAGSVIVLVVVLLLATRLSPLPPGSVPKEWSWRAAPLRRLIALQVFCVVAFSLWAVVFGIQRYAIPIEMLCVPIVVATCGLLVARIWAQQVLLIALAAGLAVTTVTVNWGRIPMPHGPAIPVGSTSALQRYDAIILAPTPPIGHVITATGGSAANGTRPSWFGAPASDADAARADRLMPRRDVGVIFRADSGDGPERAREAAAWYGFRVTSRCQDVAAPLSDPLRVCDLVPAGS